MEKEYKGTNGILIINDNGVLIKPGKRGFLLSGGLVRGDKSIPYSSIVAVQFRKAKWFAGYIQLTLIGGSDARGGIYQAIRDENTITFNTWKKNKEFEEAKEIIERKIMQARGSASHSDADELEKYSALKSKGVITEAEFQAKKKQILGL